jgi:hypothetical protein
MRLKPSLILLCLLPAAWLAAAGCGDAKCDACPTNPDTQDNTCSVWEGVYFGAMTGGSGSCGDVTAILTGTIRVDVGGVVTGGGETPETLLEITLTDEQGNWTVFSGRICNTEDTKSPYAYPFTVSFNQSDFERGFQVVNQLAGYFSQDSAESPRYLDANYSISFSDLNNPDNSCTFQARLQTER